jgi:predicted DNA-binding transcriptional regulator YafY
VKMDRLIGILSILLQRERVTAPELAEQFEVSRRTIQRDIEALCRAGIPLSTAQGAGGGISIMEGYRVDRTVLTDPEMQAILAGLRSLDSVSGTRRYAQLMEKLSPGTGRLVPGSSSMLIDLSSWYKTSLPPKIEIIRAAMEQNRTVRFHYFSPKGETTRTAEPYYLVFHWSDWYVWAWCRTRRDFRLFKLNRMTGLATGGSFAPRPAPLPDLDPERIFPAAYQAVVLFDPACKWRLVEEYGADSFTSGPDGRLRFSGGFPDADSILSWLLTFGDKAELLEPAELRDELHRLGCRLAGRYERRKEDGVP